MVRFKRAGRLLLAAALTTSTTVGCKNGFAVPVWNPFAKAPPAATNNVVPNNPTFGTAESESTWSTPFKKFGETVSAPFKAAESTKKSDATKPTPGDPVSLATKVTPPNAALYVSLAKLQERSGNTAAAVEEYNKALDADPKDLPALLGLARLYDHQGRFEEALKLYRTAVELHPDNAAVMNDYGLCLARSGKIKDSATAMRRAVTLDPEKVLYRNNLATVLVELDRTDEAYQTLVSVHGEAVAHYNVGFLLNKRGDIASKCLAYKHFQVATKLNPNFKEAQQWVDILGKDTAVAAVNPTLPAKPAVEPMPELDLTPIATPVPRQEPVTAPIPSPTTTTVTQPAQSAAPYPSTSPTSALPELPLISTDAPAAPTAPSPPVRPVSKPTVLEPADAQSEPTGPRLPLNPQTQRTAPATPTQKPSAVVQVQDAPAVAAAPATKPAAMPPVPEQVSSLNPAASTSATPAAKTTETKSAARYPASRY